DGKPGRVFFTDGESVPEPKKRTEIHFVAACRERYAEKPRNAPEFGNAPPRSSEGLAVDTPDLAVAAWLYRRGEKELAARALAAGRRPDDDERGPAGPLRAELAKHAYGRMREAFEARADEDALAHGERLLRLYGAEADKLCPQARAVVADLQRRQ